MFVEENNAAVMCTTIYFYLLKFLQFRLLEDFFIKNNKAGCIYLIKEQCTFLFSNVLKKTNVFVQKDAKCC